MIPLLAILLLIMLTIFISIGFSTPGVKGWHMTIYPPYFPTVVTVALFLLFALIGYWLVSLQADKISWTLYALHLLPPAIPMACSGKI
jgi:hypothetical protein